MFTEFKCGCIQSIEQGRVRICDTHRPEKATGDGALASMPAKLPRVVRQYPGNGQAVYRWNGGK